MKLSRGAAIGLASLATLFIAGVKVADAQSSREIGRSGQSRVPGKPMMAIVSLSDQRITVYDSVGRISQAPVSTGSAGYETPAGIFSIVQKNEFHQSNLYEDGEMPFMQRITWTGIALHAGVLPGHPASHGCIRLPMAFAESLFGVTQLGMRVILVRDDMAPSDISHPALFKSKPVPKGLAPTVPQGRRQSPKGGAATERVAYSPAEVSPGSAQHLELLKSAAAAKSAELEAAVGREREAKQAAARKSAEAGSALKLLRAAEASHVKAEAALEAVERRLGKASPESAQQVEPAKAQQAEVARAKALLAVGEAQTRLEAAKLQAQAKADAAEVAGAEAQVAAAARASVAEAAEAAEQNTAPVSVFVSRKTQRFYIRKANIPIYEGPVTIRDADRMIGTFVFTALGPANASGEMRWSVVAMYRNPTNIEPASQERGSQARVRKAEANPTDTVAAAAVLDRIQLPEHALERISEVVLPGSSLIISDEAASRETGKDTDFVVVMSGEPQGALKIRQREPRPQYDDGYFWRSPYRDYPPYFSSRPDRPRQGRYPWW
jgi:hypothetical protein